jgi:Protein of unknown function (DUF3455)
MKNKRTAALSLPLGALLTAALAAQPQTQVSAPATSTPLPEAIRTPPAETLVLRAHAMGAQIYLCQAGADGKQQWTLKAPDADLMDDQGTVIGHHSAGPAWQLADGSAVTGKAVARVDSPDSHSIPWLLVEVVGHQGEGLLASVAHIQRIYTRGGQAPAAGDCDATRSNAEVRIPYSADYYFYAPRSK